MIKQSYLRILLLLVIIAMPLAACAESDTGREQYRLVINQNCDDSDMRISVCLYREGKDIRLNGIHNDTAVMVTPTKTRNRQLFDQLYFPGNAFSLKVLLDQDTASFSVEYDSEGIRVEYMTRLDNLELVDLKSIDADIIWIQLYGESTEHQMRAAMRDVNDGLKGYAEVVVLPEGYYRCLPEKVFELDVRRHKSANRTPVGQIIFVRLLKPDDAEARSSVEEWLLDYQRSTM